MGSYICFVKTIPYFVPHPIYIYSEGETKNAREAKN